MQQWMRGQAAKAADKLDKRFHGVKWKGTIEIETKNRFFHIAPDLFSGFSDALHDIAGFTVQFELVGIHPETGAAKLSGKKSMKRKLQVTGELKNTVGFRVDQDFGEPAALLVHSHHSHEFILEHVKLECGLLCFHFPCHSWVYNLKKYGSCPRIFFTNKAYLPRETPAGLQKYREEALQQLRGEIGGAKGGRQEPDRIYDYDVYNDLGDPRIGLARKVLGGSSEFPYPRRCKTGRKQIGSSDEEPASAASSLYVPRDEQFDNTKRGGVLFDGIKTLIPRLLPKLKPGSTCLDSSKFSSLRQIHRLYSKKTREEGCGTIREKMLDLAEATHLIPKIVKQLLEDPLGYFVNFSCPQILQQAPDLESCREWKEDEEFGRQTLAGVNPLVIERVKVLPKGSLLAAQLAGKRLDDGLTVEQAIAHNRLYIVDYYDAFLPFVEKANQLDDNKMYASRTVFFLTDGILKPIAIELSVSQNDGGSRVFFPPRDKEQGWLWHLAKAHATINDASYHELISHWLRTHACMEPFIIATHRRLSALHPVNVLLEPHCKDTLQINALARQILINAYNPTDTKLLEAIPSGIIEMGFCTDKYSMEFSSFVYKKTWRFDEQALPTDLIKRGMAVQDPSSKHNLRLYIEDYPYAVDGLEIWFAIKSWVNSYLSIYYENDTAVKDDLELQNWWLEIKEKGHGDKKNENWWVEMKTKEELEEVIVTIIWIASAHHAAVNFGQYAYGGFMPNRPTRASKLIPAEGTEEYKKLLTDSTEKFYLESLANQKQATVVMATLEILSNHSSNEEYLGERKIHHWTSNERVLHAFTKFATCISDIGKNIKDRNEDPKLKNRKGLVQIPYTLLLPKSSPGLTGQGIPNSISI